MPSAKFIRNRSSFGKEAATSPNACYFEGAIYINFNIDAVKW
jgi:hypothetical protein